VFRNIAITALLKSEYMSTPVAEQELSLRARTALAPRYVGPTKRNAGGRRDNMPLKSPHLSI